MIQDGEDYILERLVVRKLLDRNNIPAEQTITETIIIPFEQYSVCNTTLSLHYHKSNIPSVTRHYHMSRIPSVTLSHEQYSFCNTTLSHDQNSICNTTLSPPSPPPLHLQPSSSSPLNSSSFLCPLCRM